MRTAAHFPTFISRLYKYINNNKIRHEKLPFVAHSRILNYSYISMMMFKLKKKYTLFLFSDQFIDVLMNLIEY